MKYIENGTCGQVSVYAQHKIVHLRSFSSDYPLVLLLLLVAHVFINSRDYRHTHSTRHFSCPLDLKGDLALSSFFSQDYYAVRFSFPLVMSKSFRHQQNIQKHFPLFNFFFFLQPKNVSGRTCIQIKTYGRERDESSLMTGRDFRQKETDFGGRLWRNQMMLKKRNSIPKRVARE